MDSRPKIVRMRRTMMKLARTMAKPMRLMARREEACWILSGEPSDMMYLMEAMTRLMKKAKPTRKKARLMRLIEPVPWPPERKLPIFQVVR